jgi:hypothetical protein
MSLWGQNCGSHKNRATVVTRSNGNRLATRSSLRLRPGGRSIHELGSQHRGRNEKLYPASTRRPKRKTPTKLHARNSREKRKRAHRWLLDLCFKPRQQGRMDRLLPQSLFWGKGYATETANALVDFGFDKLNLHRVFATCDPANTASAHVLEKIGMKREGRMREHMWARGKWRDSLLYAILEHERVHARSGQG